ncbi:MAG TPA: queuosine precursor transporter [Candidatus Paceibacterota bacterium]|nr:queuosine precursor transporter [Candidatus Paceibacterota bacterium]
MNEFLLLVTAILSASAVVVAWRAGKERLYTVMLVFLLLVSTFGGKVAVFFGHSTNTGNIFYASVYLATYFVIERYGAREGLYSIWVGVLGVTVFLLLGGLSVLLVSVPATANLSAALSMAFAPVPRIAFASMVAYVVSQNFNVRLYIRLKRQSGSEHLWWRANAANAVAQVIDSIVFFVVAFIGSVPGPDIIGIILTGLAIKIVYMMIASPLLYLNRVVEEDDDGNGNAMVVLT